MRDERKERERSRGQGRGEENRGESVEEGKGG